MSNKNNENNEKNNKKFYIIENINELPNILKSIPFDKGNTLINELYELIKSIYNKSTTLNSNILHYNNNLDTILEQFKEIILDNENIKSKIDVLKNEINNINNINNISIKINNTLKSNILYFKNIQNSIKICIYYKHKNINKYIDLIKIEIANIINNEYNKLNIKLNQINNNKDKCYNSNLIKNLINKIKIFEKYTNDLNNKIVSKKNTISSRIKPIINRIKPIIQYENIFNNKNKTIMVNNPLFKKKLTNFLERYKSIQSIRNTKPYINSYLPNIKTIPSNYEKIISNSEALTRDSKKFLINYIKKKKI